MNISSDSYIYNLISTDFKLIQHNIDLIALAKFLSDEIQILGVKVVGIVGGVACGKSILSEELRRNLGNSIVLSTDNYVKGTREWRRNEIVAKQKNPLLKYDFELLNKNIEHLRLGKRVLLPQYDQLTGLAIEDTLDKYRIIDKKTDYIIVEGDFFEYTRPDLLLYIHASDELRKSLRIERDTAKRNEGNILKLLEDIELRNQQQHFPYTLPCSNSADIIVVLNFENNAFKYNVYKRM